MSRPLRQARELRLVGGSRHGYRVARFLELFTGIPLILGHGANCGHREGGGGTLIEAVLKHQLAQYINAIGLLRQNISTKV